MQFTGERYDGELHKNGSMDGKGKYIFPDGSYYKGEMKDGMFHGQGTMYFIGHGKYKALWHEGSVVKGEYTFSDGLVCAPDSWTYCTPGDRRFFCEVQNGLRPAGESLFTNTPSTASSAPSTPVTAPSTPLGPTTPHPIPSVPVTPSTASAPSTRPPSSSSSAPNSNPVTPSTPSTPSAPFTPKDKIAKRSTPPASPKHR